MICDKWLTDFPMFQMLIGEFFALHPDIPRPSDGQMIQWLSFAELEDCDTYGGLTRQDVILVGGGTLHKPVDIGEAILISDCGMISAPLACGYFHTRRTIVCMPVFQRLNTVDGNVVSPLSIDTPEPRNVSVFVESENCPGLFFHEEDYAKMHPEKSETE